MSFSDIGRSGAAKRPNSQSIGQPNLHLSHSSLPGSSSYAALSQLILQFQQNVGILSTIIGNMTHEEGLISQKQYKVQVDVIQQIGVKIDQHLKTLEQEMVSLSREEASKCRATHIKLTRDYHWVEQKFKNLILEYKQKRNALEVERRMAVEEEHRKNFQQGIDGESQRLQLQLQDDRVTEEIMREREEEVRKINKGMHQVNQIYKDLASIVSYQQDQVDEAEKHMERANENAAAGLKQIEKAYAKASESNCLIS